MSAKTLAVLAVAILLDLSFAGRVLATDTEMAVDEGRSQPAPGAAEPETEPSRSSIERVDPRESARSDVSVGQLRDGIRRGLAEAGVVVGNPAGKVLLAAGDVVSVRFDRSMQPQAGDTMTVVRREHRVVHPATGRPMGRLFKVVGTITLDQTIGRFWSARIVDSPDFIAVGDSVVAGEMQDAGEETASSDAGYIVTVPNQEVLVGAYQVVYTDLGSAQGAQPGQSFSVIRAETSGRSGSPPRKIGEIKIVAVQPTSSSALITRSSEPIEIGDRLEVLPPR